MARVFFITVNNLKEDTTINWAVEDKLLETSIYDSQRIDIEPILGTDLYNKISDEIEAETLAGVYKVLMDDYIYYTLVKASMKRSLIYLFAKIREKGVISKDDPGATTVDITILNKMRDEVYSDFGYYANRLKDYLCDNSSDYPEYSTNTGSDLDPNKTDSYFVGLQLTDDKKCGSCNC